MDTRAKSTPMSRSCFPQTSAAASSNAGSKEQAAARFTGSRQPSRAWWPWGHSEENSTGMPSRECSSTYRWTSFRVRTARGPSRPVSKSFPDQGSARWRP